MDFENDDVRICRMTSMGEYKVVKLMMNEEPTGNKAEMLKACNSNPWLFADVHISSNTKRTNDIVKRFTSVLKQGDPVICLGDLCDKHTSNMELVTSFVNRINTGNMFLILGNNDYYTISDYIKMGFKYVTDEFSFKKDGKDIVMTHAPIPTRSKRINIHGHIHGSGVYWNMNPAGHYDVFVGTDECPDIVRMDTLLNTNKVNTYRKVT